MIAPDPKYPTTLVPPVPSSPDEPFLNPTAPVPHFSTLDEFHRELQEIIARPAETPSEVVASPAPPPSPVAPLGLEPNLPTEEVLPQELQEPEEDTLAPLPEVLPPAVVPVVLELPEEPEVTHASIPQRLPNLEIVGFPLRLAAGFLDGVFLALVFSFTAFLVPFVKGVFTRDVGGAEKWVIVLFLLFCWLYFAVCESLVKKGTVGKRTFKLRVQSEKGGDVSFPAALLRSFFKIVFVPGFLTVLFGQRHRALHDIISRTVVSRARTV